MDAHRNLSASAAASAGRLHPQLAAAMPRLPGESLVWRGLPFDLGPADTATVPRWIALTEAVSIPLDSGRPASHLVVAHLCDVWRGPDGRPEAIPPGHVVPIGQPLARYTVEASNGRTFERVVRRRFEVGDGMLGWGSVAFASVTHLDNEPLDWRGPHERLTPGRYAAIGQSGALTVIPGKYGGNLVGASDVVPSATDDAFLWLHAITLDRDALPTALRMEPLALDVPGSLVLVAAVTLFHGTDDPLRRQPRMAVLATGLDGPPAIDLGTVIRTLAPVVEPAPSATIVGWGLPRQDPEPVPGGPQIVEFGAASDALLHLDGWSVPVSSLAPGVPVVGPGGRTIVPLPARSIPVQVTVRDATTGAAIPARVRFTSPDGRYLPPNSHRDEVNPGILEDTGGDLILGSAAYAYIPGEFGISLPPGTVNVEVVSGFERRPLRTTLEVGPGSQSLDLALERVADLRADGWVVSDGHVHFLPPSTAMLQAAAEDVDLVHLLATQWGDLFTNISDLPWGSQTAARGRPMVVMGTENRQNILGHLALLGARHPTLPLASAGPPEGRMAGALEVLLADWAERCRANGGLVVGAHFPLPYAEIAADIVAGRIDALEAQALPPGLDDPMILEWYRYLRLGYRLPIVGGTDKMSAEVPVGAVRTYARLGWDVPLTFEAWAAAVRAGRTFVTSGPLLQFAVDGAEPGDTVRMRAPGHVTVRAVATAAQPVIGDLEIVLDGRVVASVSADPAAAGLQLDESVPIAASGWVSARLRSPHHIESAFATSMAAHTSPVYLDVAGRSAEPSSDDVAVVKQVILGARTWVAEIAAVTDARERARMTGFLDGALRSLEARLRAGR